MFIEEKEAYAEVFRETVDKTTNQPLYIVKVSFPDIGLYINGIRAMRSIEYPDNPLWIQLPVFKLPNGSIIKHIEVAATSDLRTAINELSRKAVAEYLKRKNQHGDSLSRPP